MSVDTRTPGTGFDDAPALSMVKVPCDPAQVIVNHASFRVQLPAAKLPRSPRITAVGASAAGLIPAAAGASVVRRRAPVVWSGKSAPGDLAATGLLQAARQAEVAQGAEDFGDGAATQVIPRITVDALIDGEATVETPQVVGPRAPEGDETRLIPTVSAYDSAYDGYFRPDGAGTGEPHFPDGEEEFDEEAQARRGDPVRHAYYPGRRLNLGVVLLPLRIFLGFISIYAGMGKLCDPVYFDGGERGSMVKWLTSLHPWPLAEPLRDFALQHPVGAGLVIAFLQVIVGVLTVLGLWQRAAAVIGALLSAALLVTVSWKTVPAYDAPDIIYLAAWSPLIIAGAPFYSVDARLASEAWRTLGPRSELWELRRRVLRRGLLIGTFVVGATLLIGAVLGGAVRSSHTVTVPGPGQPPRNELPGSPLPSQSREGRDASKSPSSSKSPTEGATSAPPSDSASTPESVQEPGSVGAEQPSETAGSGQAPPQQSAPPPAASSGPTSGGSDGSGGSSGEPGDGSGGGSGGGEEPGLIGGILG
ncbi:DoxX family protein [Streptomyces sp. TRM66268-LWL]|uniref:DoxX family protein n=1 Tax=Streptomyces polyasparticus TaxID=2767826 RepID=A0ABR7SPR0_9ACTN|nr:DoxX family protein [Streptomyces polyasparticus]MBC9716577.1 DoxX family protein [Streptomyces polyasparticus]